jgi:uncharacterized membrane protein YgaE (UPF0421/DUF939 family)
MSTPPLESPGPSARRTRIDVGALARLPFRRFADRVLPDLPSLVRLVVAAVLSFLLGQIVMPGGTDLTAPLTALLVVQASLYQTLRSGIGRVVAVLSGVGIAVILSTWLGLTWWSLGAAITLALVIGSMLDLGDHRLEVPISAMLILGVSQYDAAAEVRLVNTLIGAAVGMAFAILVPPPVRTRDAVSAVRQVAVGASEVVRRAGLEVLDGLTRANVESWLEEVHRLLPLVGEADLALTEADDSRRLNPRAAVSVNRIPVLREGLNALDRSLLAIRQVLLSLAEETPERSAGSTERPTLLSDGTEEELRAVFSVVLLDIADCVAAFGALIDAEAAGDEDQAEDRLAEALEILRETRARLTELTFLDPSVSGSTWLIRGSLLSGVERILHELDLEDHARERRRLVQETSHRAQRRAAIMNPWGIRVLDIFASEDELPGAVPPAVPSPLRIFRVRRR